MEDKFERTGYTAVKSEFVNGPIIEEFPVVMECQLAEVVKTESFYCIVGKIVNTAAEEAVLSENGKIDPSKLDALIFDQFQHGYYVCLLYTSSSEPVPTNRAGELPEKSEELTICGLVPVIDSNLS